METKISATELAKGLSDILNRVRYRGERFVVERNGEPIATLAPSGPASAITLSELAVQLHDLVPVGGSFAEDIEEIQSSQPRAEMPEWAS